MKLHRFALLASAVLTSPALAHVGHAVLIAPEEVDAAGRAVEPSGASGGREWLAGDHHVHSEFSAAYPLVGSLVLANPTFIQIDPQV